VELLDHFWYVGGVVLQIGVDCDDDFAAGVGEPGGQGGGLPEILAKTDYADPCVRLLYLGQEIEAAIDAAVIDEEYFVFVPVFEGLGDLLIERADIVLLIQQRRYDANLWALIHF
jgi:hypothetical protein